MTKVTRVHCPDLRAILHTSGSIFELGDNQSWYRTEKRYEIWWDGPNPLPRRVASFFRRNTATVFMYDAKTIECPTDPAGRFLYRQLKAAEDLLREALHSVDADEGDRAESWPDEIERGELTLDLGERIRVYLGEAQNG